jgi:hypothetical protein
MALRPLVIKLHFYTPTPKDRAGALSHLDYMGNPKKEELVRAGEDAERDDSAAIHAAYMESRSGSTGYIGPDDRSLPDPSVIASELRSHEGPVWRAIISVTETDARSMGGQLLARPAWEDAARDVVPRMADAMGIKRDDLEWVAAMHRKEGHPHLHLLFWEKTAERKRGVLSDGERRDVRKLWVQSLYRPERDRLGLEKQLLRENLVQGSRAELNATRVKWKRTKEPESIPYPPRPATTQAQELADKLHTLSEHMPGTGRAALKYMPPEVKAEARQITEWLVSRVPEYKQTFDRYVEIAREYAQHYSDNPDYLKNAEEKARGDIQDRMAQGVIKQAASLDRAAKREEVVSAAVAAIRGKDAEGLPESLKSQVHREVTEMANLKGDERQQRAEDLAQRLLKDPVLQPAMENYRKAGGSEERLATALAKTINNSADFVNFQRTNTSHQAAVAWWMGMMNALRQQEQNVEQLVAEEEA